MQQKKGSNIFFGDPVIRTFKKLNYERKLSLYFSLLTSLVLKILKKKILKIRSEFQIR